MRISLNPIPRFSALCHNCVFCAKNLNNHVFCSTWLISLITQIIDVILRHQDIYCCIFNSLMPQANLDHNGIFEICFHFFQNNFCAYSLSSWNVFIQSLQKRKLSFLVRGLYIFNVLWSHDFIFSCLQLCYF